MNLFAELRRRNVFRVAIGYIVSSWLLAQVADLVLDVIGAPGWVMRAIVLLLALGLPIAVFFAWAYEVTPEGIKRESEIDRSQSISHVTGRKLDRAIFVVLILALAYFIWESRFSDRASEVFTEKAVQAEATDESAGAGDSPVQAPLPATPSIAVLPFDNRSKLEDDIFFTEGIHDDLLTNLARIGSLKVISRTSVMRYQDTLLSIPEIAQELGVSTVLEGAVQRAGGTVRINVQLIDARTDEHLWAQIYDRELTAENLFAIQTEISQYIADALQAELSPEEEKRISAAPTENLAAYEAFSQGRQRERQGTDEDMRAALTLYRQATDLDPDFAAAWAARARMVLELRQTGFRGEIPSEEAFVLALSNIERALEIDPQSAEALTVRARMHWEQYRFEDALASLELALSINPNLAYAYQEQSQVLSSTGDIKAAWEAIMKAMERDPFDRTARFLAFSLVIRHMGSEYFELLRPHLDAEPMLQFALDLMLRWRTEASMAAVYRDLPPTAIGAGAVIFFMSQELKEMRTGSMEDALRPAEFLLDAHIMSGQWTDALETYDGLSEERRQVSINLERLSIIQMAMGLCEEGLATLDLAHDGTIRIYGQIQPNQTRSNPNLALNRVWCLRQTGRGAEAAPIISALRKYAERFSNNADFGYNMLVMKLLILDGQPEQAIAVYEQALDGRDMTWFDRFDPIIHTLDGDPVLDALNDRIDARINADRADLGWQPTQGFSWDSDSEQSVDN